MDGIDDLIKQQIARRKLSKARDRARSVLQTDIPDDIVDEFYKTTGVESGRSHFNPDGSIKLGPATKTGERAIGFSQILPGTAKKYQAKGLNPQDETDNIAMGLAEYFSGGQDPIARRLAYVGGGNSAALRQYQQTGDVPDTKLYSYLPGNQETYKSYVEKTGGFDSIDNLIKQQISAKRGTITPTAPAAPVRDVTSPVVDNVDDLISQQKAARATPPPATLPAVAIEKQLTSLRDANQAQAAVVVPDDQLATVDPASVKGFKKVKTPQGTMFVNPAKAKALGVTDYTQDAAKLTAAPGVVPILPESKAAPAPPPATPIAPAAPAAPATPIDRQYEEFRKAGKLPDSEETKKEFDRLIALSEKNAREQNERDAVQGETPVATNTELPSQTPPRGVAQSARIPVKTEYDVISQGSAGTFDVDLTYKPKGEDSGRYLVRRALEGLAPEYNLTYQEIEDGLNTLKKKGSYTHQFDNLSDAQIQQLGDKNVRMSVTNSLLNSILNKRDGIEDPAKLNPALKTKYAMDLAQQRVETEGAVVPQPAPENNYLGEQESEKQLEETIRSPKYSAQQIASEAIQSLFNLPGAAISAAADLSKSIGRWYFGKPPVVSEDYVQAEKDRLKKEFGSYRQAYGRELDWKNTGWLETGIRTAAQTGRTFLKGITSDLLKSAVFMDDLYARIDPLKKLLPDKAAPSLRNAMNGIDFLTRSMQMPAADAVAQWKDHWVGSEQPLEDQQLWQVAKRVDEVIGEDPKLRGRFLGQLADAAGSSLSFLAMGILAPELSVTTRLGEFGIIPAIAGGLQAAGTGYEEARQAGVDVEKAKSYGIVQALLGMTEGFGIGGQVGRIVKNPTMARNLMEGILEVAKKGTLKEAGEEFIQELVQTTGGKIALDYYKDKDPNVYNRLINTLKKAPVNLSDTLTNEGLIAAITGGAMGTVTHGVHTALHGPESVRAGQEEEKRFEEARQIPKTEAVEAPQTVSEEKQAPEAGLIGKTVSGTFRGKTVTGEVTKQEAGKVTIQTPEGRVVQLKEEKVTEAQPAEIVKPAEEVSAQAEKVEQPAAEEKVATAPSPAVPVEEKNIHPSGIVGTATAEPQEFLFQKTKESPLGTTMKWTEMKQHLESLPLKDSFGRLTAAEKREMGAANETWKLVNLDPQTLKPVDVKEKTKFPILVSHSDVLDGRRRLAEAIDRGDKFITAWVGVDERGDILYQKTTVTPPSHGAPEKELQNWVKGTEVEEPVYHGGDSYIDIFDPAKSAEGVVYFAPTEQDAAEFSEAKGGRGRVTKAYVRIENNGIERYYELLKELGPGRRFNTDAEIYDQLRKEGYDGIDEYGGLVIAFSPDQIRVPSGETGILYKKTAPATEESRHTTELIANPEEAKKELDLQPKNNKVRTIGEKLEQWVHNKFGAIDAKDRSEEAKQKIASGLAAEAAYQLGTTAETGTGAGWYSTNYPNALNELSKIYPEFNTHPESKDLFTAILAITSNGERVAVNLKNAIGVYDAVRKGVSARKAKVESYRAEGLAGNLGAIDFLIRKFGVEGMKEHLLEPITVKDANAYLEEHGMPLVTGYPAEAVMPRAVVYFGPKLGAFYANLSGAEGYLTMDLWWSRTFNRHRGTLVPQPTDKAISGLRQILGAKGATDDEIIQMTPELEAAYRGRNHWTELEKLVGLKEKGNKAEKAKFQEALAKLDIPGRRLKQLQKMHRAEKIGNSIYKDAFKMLNEAPFNPGDRAFMIDTAKEAQRMLKDQGIDLSIADVQAALWYYEKRLYTALGKKGAADDIGYEEAIRNQATVNKPRGSAALFSKSAVTGAEGGDTERGLFQKTGTPEVGLRDRGPVRGSKELPQNPYRQKSGDDLQGLPTTFNVAGRGQVEFHSFAPAQKAAEEYMKSRGLEYNPARTYLPVNKDRAERIAREFDKMKHDPQNPEVKAAYKAMIDETLAQYKQILKTGLKVEFQDMSKPDPYAHNPRLAVLDVVENNHLYIFPTDAGFGSSDFDPKDNPLLAPTTFKISGKTALANDIFRVVHDYFGHIKEGVGFRARGEENAWASHSAMYSPLARRAMTTETRGQNSWVNFGPHAEANKTAAQAETVYADQKIGLLPEWVTTEGIAAPALPEEGALLNIGLDTNDGTGITPAEVRNALHDLGNVTIYRDAEHRSDTENTLVVHINRALTAKEADELSSKLRQEAIAQYSNGQGELYGPQAEGWRPFNPEYFLNLEGDRAAKVDEFLFQKASTTGPTMTKQQILEGIRAVNPNADMKATAALLPDGDYQAAEIPIGRIFNIYGKPDEGKVKEYTGKNTAAPPIVINDKHEVIDGKHRFTVAKRRGDKTIRVWMPAGIDPLLYQKQLQPTFYSQLERVIEQKMPQRASADQVRGIVKDTKQEERDWLGLDQWLADNPNPTRQELLDFIRANNVQIEEVFHGKTGEDVRAITEQWWNDEGGANEEKPWNELTPEEQIQAMNRYRQETGQYEEDATRYEQYKLPGGENYRELLLTLPTSTKSAKLPEHYKIEPFESISGGEQYRVFDPKDTWTSIGTGATPEEAKANALRRIANDVTRRDKYMSSHWYEPNVLAHIRFDERTDSQGRRTLHIAEIQSDWHQKGRKSGYKGQMSDEEYQTRLKRLDDLFRSLGLTAYNNEEIFTKDNRPVSATKGTPEQRAAYIEYRDFWADVNKSMSGVPDAPFKKSWHELAMKRMIRYAAENGFDAISWDTGETQGERYNIAKHIKEISVQPFEEKADPTPRSVTLHTQKGGEIGFDVSEYGEIFNSDEGSWNGKQLSEVVGESVARQIQGAVNEQNIDGKDLVVGGEGMKGFYDKILPAFVNKYIKKWGAKVENAEIIINGEFLPIQTAEEAWKLWRAGEEVGYKLEDGDFTWELDEDEMHNWTEDYSTSDPLYVATDNVRHETHSVIITPEMRAAAMEGQPLFQKISPAALAAQRKIEGADLKSLLPHVAFNAVGNHISLDNVETYEIVRRLIEGQQKEKIGSFNGVFWNTEQVRALRQVLKQGIASAKQAKLAPADVQKLIDLDRGIVQAATYSHDNFGKDAVVITLFDEAIPEETWHMQSFVNAASDLLRDRIPERVVNAIITSPIFARATTFRRQYGAYSSHIQAEEFIAKIMTSQFAELGIDPADVAQQKEAAEIALSWLEGYAENNPQADFAKFAAINTYAETVINQFNTQRQEQAAEAARQTSEAGAQDRGVQPLAGSEGGEGPPDAVSRATGAFTAGGAEKTSQTPRSLRNAGIPVSDRLYTSTTNDERIQFANEQLDKGMDVAANWLEQQLRDGNANAGATGVVGINLINHLGKTNQIEEMNRVADLLVPAVTDAAQMVQAMSLVSMFDPNNAGAYAAKLVKQKAGRDLTQKEFDRATEIATRLRDTANVDKLAESTLADAYDMLNIVGAERDAAIEAARIANDKNAQLEIDLAQANKVIAAARSISQNRKPRTQAADKPVTPYKQMIKDLESRKNEIAQKIKDAFAGEMPLFQAAWHGSPHRHNKFLMEKVGTGEGAQAYGWGLYFTDSEAIADYYRNTLSDAAQPYTGQAATYRGWNVESKPSTPEHMAAAEVAVALNRDIYEDPIAEARLQLEYKAQTDPRAVKALEALKIIRLKDFKPPSQGAKYKVDLKPAEDEYLLWDKPLSEQSEKVRNGIATLRESYDRNHALEDAERPISNEDIKWDTATLGTIYKKLSKAFDSQAQVSVDLHEIGGIRGIKYLDGTSRGKGEGSYNYVIFDENDVEITDILYQKSPEQVQYEKRIVDPRMVGGYQEATKDLLKYTYELREKYGLNTLSPLENYVTPEELARYHELTDKQDQTRRERENIKLLAPNGKRSNLSPELHALVRTPDFKRWFGDWEAAGRNEDGTWNDFGVWDRDDVSKAVDENGEPKVFYHGSTGAGFGIFRPEYTTKGPRTIGSVFFVDNRAMARTYTTESSEADIFEPREGLEPDPEEIRPFEPGIYSVFLNIRKPIEEDFEGAYFDGGRLDSYMITTDDGETIPHPETGQQYFKYRLKAVDLMQRLIDDGEFSRDEIHIAPAENHWTNTDAVAAWGRKYGDGAIIYNVIDNGPYAEVYDEATVVTVNDAKQIKSVHNLGTFDPQDPHILYQKTQLDQETHNALVDYSVLRLTGAGLGAISYEDFINELTQVTGGKLASDILSEIHADAIDKISKSKKEKVPGISEKTRNARQHYKAAREFRARDERILNTMIEEQAKRLRGQEKEAEKGKKAVARDETKQRMKILRDTIAAKRSEIAEYKGAMHKQEMAARAEMRDLLKQQAKLNRELSAKDKVAAAIISEGIENDFSDEEIFAALARKAHKDPLDAQGALEREYPTLTPSEVKNALTGGVRLWNQAKERAASDAKQIKHAFRLTEADVKSIEDEKRYNAGQTRKATVEAANFYDGLTKSGKQVALESLVNIRRANLLTGPRTHVRNVVANVAFAASEEAIRPLSWLADTIASWGTGEKTTAGVSAPAIIKSFNAVLRQDETLRNINKESGIQAAKNIMRYGTPDIEAAKLQHARSVLGEKFKLGKPIDAYINFVFDTLGAEDALFKVYAFRRSLEDQALSIARTEAKEDSSIKIKQRRDELVLRPTFVMQKIASEFADFATFQNDNVLSRTFTKFKNLHPGVKFAAETIVPYDRTPTNIVLRVLEHTPLGFGKAGYNLVKIAKGPNVKQERRLQSRFRGAVEDDLTMGSKLWPTLDKVEQRRLIDEGLKKIWTRQQQQEFAKTMGRASLGTGIYLLGFLLAAAGLLTGSMQPAGDDDREETNDFFDRKRRGIENRSLYIPGVGRFVLTDDPLMRVLTGGATAYEQMKLARKRTPVSAAWNGVKESFSDMMMEQPLANNVGGLLNVYHKGKFGEFIGNIGAGYVPASGLLSGISEIPDPLQRTGSGTVMGDRRHKIPTRQDQWKGFRNSLLKGIPGVRQIYVDPASVQVSPEERGGPLRRAARMFDLLNTRHAIPYNDHASKQLQQKLGLRPEDKKQ